MKKTGILLFCLLTGCATAPPENISLSEADATRVKPLRIHGAIAEQLTAGVNHFDTSAAHASAGVTGDPLADVLGHIFGEMLIRSAHKPAQQQRDPLLGFTTKFDLSSAYLKRLRETAARSDWLDIREVLLQEGDRGAKATADESALVLQATYGFSSDYRQLGITTFVELWAGEQDAAPVYRARYHFQSGLAGGSDQSLEAILQEWSGNEADRFRRVFNQGVEESMRMLRLGLLAARPASPVQSAGEAISLPGGIPGEVVSRGEFHLVARAENGDFYSVLRPDVHRDEYEARLKRVYHAGAIGVRSGF